MKSIFTKLPSLLAIAAILSLSSCLEKEIKELLSVDTPFEIDETFSVDLNENDPKSFEDREVIDVSVEGVEITDVKIEELTLSFSNVDVSSTASLEKLEFTIEGSNATVSTANVNIAATAGQELDLTGIANTMIAIFEDYLKNNPEATLLVKGSVNEVPVNFDMTLNLKMTVTGKPE